MNHEEKLQCPYEIAHSIGRSRFITHLVKCGAAHPGHAKLNCPFDATHVVDREEIEHHVTTCPSSGNVRNHVYTLEAQRTLGTVPLAQVATVQPAIQDEDWNGNVPTYNPDVAIQQRGIMKIIPTLSKAAKRKQRAAERQRIASYSNYDSDHSASSGWSSGSSGGSDHERELRKPKTVSKSLGAC